MLDVFFSMGTQCLLDFHLLGQRYTLITECPAQVKLFQ